MVQWPTSAPTPPKTSRNAARFGAGSTAPPTSKSPNGQLYAYRTLIDLKAQELLADGVRHALRPGMQVTAEIHLGTRTILEYLLSPVMGAFQEERRNAA